MKLTNTTGVSLSVAVWLAHNEYDFEKPTTKTVRRLSVTGLLKPTKAIILGAQVEAAQADNRDVSEFVHSKIGNSVHTAIEKAWSNGDYVDAMLSLGYPIKVIERIRINPDPDNLEPGCIPVYMEQRSERVINGFTISGKFDFIMDGGLEDFKTTSTFAYTSGSSDEKYVLQGSIYRWLNPKIVTKDHLNIQQIFKDWSAAKAERDKNYPPSQINQATFKLLSPSEVERFITRKTDEIIKYESLDQSQMPLCTDEELWRNESVFKYYANPSATARSTKNFTTYMEAETFRRSAGKGVIYEVKGKAKACSYCSAASMCKQYAEMKEAGLA